MQNIQTKIKRNTPLNNEKFRIMTINDEIGIIKLNYTGLITLNYNVDIKEDIYVGINKIINNEIDFGIPIALETNITTIFNLNSLTIFYLVVPLFR